MTLYEINEEIIKAWEDAVDEETGEIDEQAYGRIKDLEMARDDKIEGCALYIKNLLADAEAIKKEKQSLDKRAKAMENKAERIKAYIKDFLNGESFSTARVNISYRKSQAVNILDLNLIPDDYLKYAEPTPNKDAIKKALKDGVKIAGAELIDNNNMSIK